MDSKLLERAIVCIQENNNGKKPDDVGFNEAIEFKYKAMFSSVKGIVFAPSEEVANAFITNQTGIWRILRIFVISIPLIIFYIFVSFWLYASYNISIIHCIGPLLIILLSAILILLILQNKYHKNEKLYKNNIVVYKE